MVGFKVNIRRLRAIKITRFVRQNHLISLPNSHTKHQMIEMILLDSNLFSEIPPLLSSLPSLRIVTLKDNIIGNIDKPGTEIEYKL